MMILGLVIFLSIGVIIGNILYRLIQKFNQVRSKQEGNILPFWMVETLNALGLSVLYLNFGFSKELVGGAIFFFILLGISIIDIDTHTIPDPVSLGGSFLLLVVGLFIMQYSILEMLLGLIVISLTFIIIVLVSRGAMGGGDIRLGAILGLFLGWSGGLLAVIIAFFLGSLGAITLLLFKKAHSQTAIPFGPYLSLGGIISYLYGTKIMDYLS